MRSHVTLAFLVLTSCTAHRGWGLDHGSQRACLTGTLLPTGRPGPDASFAIARARWEALASLDPLAQAALLPTLRDWFPDVSDLSPAPDCEHELEAATEEALFEITPIPLSRLNVSRLVAGASPALLRRIAELPEAAFAAAARLPGERAEVAPTFSLLRRTADKLLIDRGGAEETSAWRAGIQERLQGSADARLLLDYDRYAQGAVAGQAGADVLQRESALLREWLGEPHEPRRLELVLLWLRRLGSSGARYGMTAAVEAALDPLLTHRGEVALAGGQPGAARDLHVAAVRAAFELHHPATGNFYGLPDPARFSAPVDRGPAALRADASGETALPPEARRQVLALLDGQYLAATHPFARCRLLHERLRFTPEEQRFGLVAPLLPAIAGEGAVSLTAEHLCALNALNAAATVDGATVARLLAAASLPPVRIAWARSPAWGGWTVEPRLGEDSLADAAVAALLAHVGAVGATPEGLAWLRSSAWRYVKAEVRPGGEARRTDPVSYGRDRNGRPSGLRAVDAVLEQSAAADRAQAKRLVRQMMEQSRAWLRAAPPDSLDSYEQFTWNQYAIAQWASRLDLTEDVARYLSEARVLVGSTWPPTMVEQVRELHRILTVSADALLGAPGRE